MDEKRKEEVIHELTADEIDELIPGALDGKKWMYVPSTAADCCEDVAAVRSV